MTAKCPKCGGQLFRRAQRLRWCRRCGCMPNGRFLNRAGQVTTYEQRAAMCERVRQLREQLQMRKYEMTFRNWQPEDIETVRAMLKDKKKYADIAAHFGVNRNAVASFVRRHGLVGVSSFTPFGAAKVAEARVEAIKRGRRRQKPFTPATIASLPVTPDAAPLEPPAPYVPPACGVSFADMNFLQQCNWPVSPHGSKTFLFCGAIKKGLRENPYCPKHHALGRTDSRVPRSPPVAPAMGQRRLGGRFT